MRRTLIIGIIVLALGIIGFTVQRYVYLGASNAIDIGRIEFQTTEAKTFPFQDIVYAAAVVVGVMLVVSGTRAPSHRR